MMGSIGGPSGKPRRVFPRCPLLLAALLLGVGFGAPGCGDQGASQEAAQDAIRRPVVLQDFVEGPREGPSETWAERASSHAVRAAVPPNSFVRIGGRAWVSDEVPDGGVGPVTFALEADGVRIFEKTFENPGRNARFQAEVPLDNQANQSVDFRLILDRPTPDKNYALWQRATLEQNQTVPRRPAEAGPNVLLLIVDTWRADRAGLYGAERSTTPFLDEFAKQGRVFEEAISQSSWTAPSVASILTGKYPIHHGVIHGQPLHHQNQTLAERFQDAGFSTLAVSTNPLIGADDGYEQGFETFHHLPSIRGNQSEEIFQLFTEWLEKNRDHQWFAYLHFMDPHDPYDAPSPYGQTFSDQAYDGAFADPDALNKVFRKINFGKSSPLPFTDEDIAYLEDTYDEEILSWDQQFKKLVDWLQGEGLLESTIIVVTSDHGEEFAEHGFLKHGSQLYEESIRVPLVLRAPGRVAPGRVARAVETRGIHDALIQLAGLPASSKATPALLSEPSEKPRLVFSHLKYQPKPGVARGPGLASIRDGQWKFIQWNSPKRSELYDLESDPDELQDLSARYPERTDRYDDLLAAWYSTRTKPQDSESPRDEKLENRLRALGYIE